MGSKPVRNLAVYLSPSRHLHDTDLSTSLGGCLPVLMAGDLNAKHVEWNSRVVREEADSCVTMLIIIPF
jgi:hypothetical protein